MSQTEKNSYVTYQSMVNAVSTSLTEVQKACQELELSARVESLGKMKERLDNDNFSVGIMGEFRRGKSTVINALLGKDIVPADIVPTSAAPNYIRWGTEPSAVINFKDGTSKTVPVEELSQYVTKITSEYARTAETVSEAVVYYPCQFCQNGVQIVDTPGLNDDDSMSYISERVLPTLDAIIMVLVPDSPFSETEADFVRSKVMASDLGRIIFVLNKADLLDEDDRDRLIANIKTRIQTSVADKMEELYGADSQECQAAKDKMGDIHLYPISARNALKGRLKGDMTKVADSGIAEFEKALSHLLTDERGMLKLMAPVNQILSSVMEASESADALYKGIDVDYEEFEKIYTEQKKEWIQKREEKKQYVSSLKNKALNLYNELIRQVPDMYEELSAKLNKMVDEWKLSDEELASEKTMGAAAEKMSAKLQKELQDTLFLDMEKLSMAIQQQVGDDLVDISRFSQEFQCSVKEIRGKISNKEGLSTGKIIAIDAATNICFGAFASIGGILEGWKANGVPGAIVGGAGGAAVGVAAMLAMASAGVPLLALWAAGGLITTISGKKIVGLAFRKKLKEKNVLRIKEAMKDQILEAITSARLSREMESWIKKQTDYTYDEISKKVDEELEGLLADFEREMSIINSNMAKNSSEKEQLKTRMAKINDTLKTEADRIQPVYDKLNAALNLNRDETAAL